MRRFQGNCHEATQRKIAAHRWTCAEINIRLPSFDTDAILRPGLLRKPTLQRIIIIIIISVVVDLPVRPSPVCTSSAIKSTLFLVQISLTPVKYPGSGTTTPASPWIGSTVNEQTRGSRVASFSSEQHKKAVLSQAEPRDAAVNFDTYRLVVQTAVLPLHVVRLSVRL